MIKWFLIVIIVIHGLIHLIGGINELGIAKVEGLTGKTLIVVPDTVRIVLDTVRIVLGMIWFALVLLFLMSAVGLGINRSWWKTIAIGAVIVSQILIIIWWPDARFGTIANILIITGIFLI